MPVQTLLEDAIESTTGATFKLGQTPPPYTIRVTGGFTVGTVAIQTSHDGTNWMTAVGSFAGTTDGNLVGLTNDSTAKIEYKTQYIRAVTAATGMTGTADVYLETVI